MAQGVQPYEADRISPAVQTFSTELTGYLDSLGLPAENVMVEIQQRRVVIDNIPTVLEGLAPQQREAAMYISKFVAASAVGLFDAALNYLWDETIRNIRDKAARFDLEYFFDSVATDSDRRSKLKTEADLEKLDDWELIRACRMTGLITDIGYKHLDYIRDVRNWASAAHPNQNELTGLQIASWLETCIREVLAKEPTGPVMEVRRFLRSLREEQLGPDDVEPIAVTLPTLPEELSASLVRSVLGMYTDVDIAADVRNNIKLVASVVWEACSDEPKYEAGMKLASLEANGEVTRGKLAREFMELVGGLTYLPQESLALEITTAADALLMAHNGFNNFYNEPPPARQLQRLIPASGIVPLSSVGRYVKAVTMCRIGNGHGLSQAALAVYDDLIGRFSDRQVYAFVTLVNDPEFRSRLQFTSCAENYQALTATLDRTTVNPSLKAGLSFIEAFRTDKLYNVAADVRFKRIMATLGPRK